MPNIVEFAGGIFAAWREVAHISEITGISVSALVLLGVLAYLYPPVRRFAIAAAFHVMLGYALLMYGIHIGTADKQAEWDAADKSAAKKAAARDAQANKKIAAQYGPIIANQDKQAAALNKKVSQYERTVPPAPDCVLGNSALRVRH